MSDKEKAYVAYTFRLERDLYLYLEKQAHESTMNELRRTSKNKMLNDIIRKHVEQESATNNQQQ